MSTSSGSDGNWQVLLDEKKQQVRAALESRYTDKFGKGTDFRKALESYCTQSRDFQRSRTLSKTINALHAPTEFVRAVHKYVPELKDVKATDGLEGLVWNFSLALIKLGSTRWKLQEFTAALARLNQAFPNFSIDGLSEFGSRNDVQRPLRNAFRCYMDAQLHVLFHLLANEECEMENIFKTEELNQKLQKERGMYDLMVQQATDEREKEKAHEMQPLLKHVSQQPGLVRHDGTDSDRTTNITFVTLDNGLLGKGSFGEVYRVAESSMGAEFARKCIHINLCASSGRTEQDVIKEVSIMQKLRHRHITTVLFHAKIDNTFNIFMSPAADYDLKAFLFKCTQENFPEAMTKQIDGWYGCLLDALAYAHTCGVKHQDIKPENILIKGKAPFLSDFGLARDFSGLRDSGSRTGRVYGNQMYRAPEVKEDGRHGRGADVFSMGCVFSEMFTISRKKSLEDYELHRKKKIYRDSLPLVSKWVRSFDNGQLNDIIKEEILSMIHEDTEKRLSASDALKFMKRESAFFCVETH